MNNWNEFKSISYQAELAFKTMLNDRQAGEEMFRDLLELHPRDGMVYYKRGMAYAELHEYALAHEDYSKAEMYFPLQEWKRKASEQDAKLPTNKPGMFE